MKKELLSPAGNLESLYQAVNNGADAVYISGKNYGARHFATNFTIDEIEKAAKYCRLHDVKLYVTVNTLIYDNEFDDVIDYIRKLHLIGVDALIMQDIGLIKLVHEKFPNLEIHASTQLHNHNEEGINFLKQLGVTRVVLARELSIEEITNIKTDLEKEAFIHGALCISYSGECLFSSIVLNRSGNRGECAGFCRLPYELYKDNEKLNLQGNYLLSPKELSSINNIKQILDSDIKSLKIEGRMKSPEYVGFITKIYRTLIDKYYKNEKLEITDEEYKNLKKLFNRCFTKGYLNNETNKDIINIKSPNHQGIPIGNVIEVNKNKIKIKLTDELNQQDGIRFSNGEGLIANFIYNNKGLLISSAKKGETIYIDNKISLKEKGIVLKTTDTKLLNELKNYKEIKIPVSFIVKAKINEPLEITIKQNNEKRKVKGNIITKALNNETTKEEITKKLSKLGNTPFILDKIEYQKDDNIFIPLKELNEIRRDLCNKLQALKEQNKIKFIEQEAISKTYKVIKTNEISVLARTEEQIKALINKNVNIYIEDYKLYKKYENKNTYYRTPRVDNLKKEINATNFVVSTTGAIEKYKDKNIVGDIYLNVLNSKTIEFYHKYLNKIGLSIELKDNDLSLLTKNLNNNYNLEILVYGKPELMIMKYCPLNALINKDKICSVCKNNNKYYLKDRNNEYYKLNQNNCITTITNYKNIDKIDNINFYKNLKITNFRIDLLDETYEQTIEILRRIEDKLK